MDGDIAKLADFGLATPIVITNTSPEGRPSNHVWGLTNQYAAPERFPGLPVSEGREERINTQCDVYSFALLLYFMWTQKVLIPLPYQVFYIFLTK